MKKIQVNRKNRRLLAAVKRKKSKPIIKEGAEKNPQYAFRIYLNRDTQYILRRVQENLKKFFGLEISVRSIISTAINRETERALSEPKAFRKLVKSLKVDRATRFSSLPITIAVDRESHEALCEVISSIRDDVGLKTTLLRKYICQYYEPKMTNIEKLDKLQYWENESSKKRWG